MGTPTLHIWPARWDLPSLDAECLSTLLYVQLAIPGRFTVSESTNPDQSPTGHLPYLTHGMHTVGSYASIARYIAALNPATLSRNGPVDTPDIFSADLDVMLSPSERATRTAWAAHVQYVLGDLLAHSLYSLPDNYNNLVHPTIAQLYPVPQRYYVPSRLRALYAPRLDASGLWSLAGEELEDTEAERKLQESRFPRDAAPRSSQPPPLDRIKIWKNTFFRERVAERTRVAFEPYARLLHEKSFFFYDRPTSLDVLLASRVLLLTAPPFPDPLIGDVLRTSFPTLITHAQLVLKTAFPTRPFSDNYTVLPNERPTLSSLLPPLSMLWERPRHAELKPKLADEVRFERGRWLWFGMAALGTIAYWVLTPQTFVLAFANSDDDQVAADPGEEDEVEDEDEDVVEEGDGGDDE